jgi:hypothetical protein
MVILSREKGVHDREAANSAKHKTYEYQRELVPAALDPGV